MRIPLIVSAIALLACSAPEAKVASTREPLAQLARFPAFAAHLGRGAEVVRFERGFRSKASDWKLVDGLAITITDGTTRIARSDQPDAWIELGMPVGKPEVHGGALVLRDAVHATDLVQVVESSRYEEYRILRDPSAVPLLRYRIRRGPAIASLRVVEGRVEAIDVAGHARLIAAPSFALDDRGVRRELSTRIEGDELVSALDTTDLAYPISVDPLWTPTPDLSPPRTLHGAAPIPGGKALIAGGVRFSGSSSPLNATLAWDPTAKAWASLANLPSGADSFVLTVLSSGKLLLTGGNVAGLPNRSATVYDPGANAWSSAGSHGTPYLATVVAAISGDRALAVSAPDALLWSLSTSTFVAAGTSTVTHDGHTATGLAGDQVVVIGGAATKVVDLWNPTTKTFANGGTLAAFHTQHTATLLSSGKVLVVGGVGQSTAELYDPVAKTFTAAGAMAGVRSDHTASLLPGDRVLIVGGKDGTGAVLSTTEIYDAATNAWTAGPPMSTPRLHHTATVMPGPKVLVVAGESGTSVLSTAEWFEPLAKGTSCSKDSDCTSGFCADGVCCDTACKGQCEACDVTGSVGTCAVVAGEPHGTRTACEPGGTGVCARACDGVDRSKCNFAAKTVVCADASCAAGSATAQSTCDGAGSCPTPAKTDCGAYACGDAVCKTSCGSNADCGGAYVCDLATGRCIVAVESHCSADGRIEVPTDPSKPTRTCTPFACDSTTGKCIDRCASSRDCVGGAACDTAAGVCSAAAPKADGGDSGGCSVARGGQPFGLSILLLACGVALRRRRAINGGARGPDAPPSRPHRPPTRRA